MAGSLFARRQRAYEGSAHEGSVPLLCAGSCLFTRVHVHDV